MESIVLSRLAEVRFLREGFYQVDFRIGSSGLVSVLDWVSRELRLGGGGVYNMVKY